MRVTWPTNAATSTKPRVFVGLSGGVDSAVSAALLQQQGYDVTGVFIRIVLPGYPCTALQDRLDAMRVAAHLKIPFTEVDLSAEYAQRVFAASLKEWERGRTPNPDALCNREIKFGLFFAWCLQQGAQYVATGHYAQTKDGLLYKGVDEDKDQSYFLWAVPREVLRQTLFPVGALKKPEVRRLAKKFGLPNAGRKDSQGLCFLGPVSIDEMLVREVDLIQGDVLDETGAVVGRHKGIQAYTLGQRHGFELFAHTPETPPHYVVEKDAAFNTLTVSSSRYPCGAKTTLITLDEVNWIGPVPKTKLAARYRYRQSLIPARLDLERSEIVLREPHAVPAGQSLVLYQGERCVGGGVILNARYGDTHSKSRRHARAV